MRGRLRLFVAATLVAAVLWETNPVQGQSPFLEGPLGGGAHARITAPPLPLGNDVPALGAAGEGTPYRWVQTASRDEDPVWVTALGLTLAVAGMGALGYSQGYLGGTLIDTACFPTGSAAGSAGFKGGVVSGASAIAVAVPVSRIVRRRRAARDQPAAVQASQERRRHRGGDAALAALLTTTGGAVIGAAGGAIAPGGEDGCRGRGQAARNGALQVGVGGLFTWPLALLGP